MELLYAQQSAPKYFKAGIAGDSGGDDVKEMRTEKCKSKTEGFKIE